MKFCQFIKIIKKGSYLSFMSPGFILASTCNKISPTEFFFLLLLLLLEGKLAFMVTVKQNASIKWNVPVFCGEKKSLNPFTVINLCKKSASASPMISQGEKASEQCVRWLLDNKSATDASSMMTYDK